MASTASPKAVHADTTMSKFMLSSVTPSVPMKINPSHIALSGSGLFVTEAVDAGRELYRSEPLVVCLDGQAKPSVCHFCLRDAGAGIGPAAPSAAADVKACMGCRVARFCSKKCQKQAWAKFHKDECRILGDLPGLPAKHLVLYRLMFWQERNMISKIVGRALEYLETHFAEYSDDASRATNTVNAAMTIREQTRSKLDMAVAWRMLPAMHTNCIDIRPPSEKEPMGAALDLLTSMINHSCDANAFVFFEGTQLRVRALKNIRAGGEVTICYVDPTVHVSMRRDVLRNDHFFECRCPRCKAELLESAERLGFDSEKTQALQKVQKDMLELVNSAVRAASYPGVYPAFEDLAKVEQKLQAMLRRVFPPPAEWPGHMEPLPSTRLSLALLHLAQGNHSSAVRNAMKGKLLSRRRSGPEWVNEMMDVLRVLMAVGNLAKDAAVFADPTFPDLFEMRDVAYGYMYALHRETERVFGASDSTFAAATRDWYEAMVERVGDPKPGTAPFAERFNVAQRKLLASLCVDEPYGIVLPALTSSS